MSNKFEEKVKPLLVYIGTIGAVLMAIAYIIIVFVMIQGFSYRQSTNTIVFALINAVVGLLISNFLRYQGVSFAKELDCNKEIITKYYSTRTKDKKNHSMTYFWTKSIITDVFVKGFSVVFTTFGLIYFVIVGSKDWNLLLLALVNLIMFICFGLIALSKSYDYFNQTYIAYMKEKINEVNTNEKTTHES